jgi:3-deoxy-D-manno-octulosonic acid kinase
MLTEKMIWGVIPDGFKKVTERGGNFLVVRKDRAGEINARICRDAIPDARYRGRSSLRAICLQDGNVALVRNYQHGGLLGRLTRQWFFTWPPRPFRELAITEELRRRGLRTVEVYAAGVQRVCGPFYRGCLVTRELRGAKDLWTVLQDEALGPSELSSALRAAAETVRAMHREGVYHGDLNLKNILIQPNPGGVDGYVIDLDKAKLFLGKLPPPLAKKNLKRLLRSALKLDPGQRFLSAASWSEFLRFYHGTADS